ncbi:MAG TPA: hypothetical protein VGQ41_16045 [Pyrinomonadaceae bacterium]|jgi:hypothetical protein|nr:hypothetical protein [Pyrinomonadaceae bacterium]
MENKTLNQKTLIIFAPLLILTGIAGFVIPEQYSLMSGAAPYNLFHIFFGATGLLITMANSDVLASSFNLGFGLIDLYQVLASVIGLTPIQYFHWTYGDDVAHVLLGFALVLIGGYGLSRKMAPKAQN